ncbi:helix-turn-helix domain-containing protein [Paraburkholderia sp. 22099]|jgi:AraC family transcriptional regulator|uniref:AraC family transcriptional regulator n=1 Tax=Paraburkholderia TaxID=1822464 RepID=UPI00285EEB9D|nr:AraC family transcriptional regulator [Paraburkholderia terricola]MDR6448679.1 AraC family transcriptional regulator [Paraburkholderia terricola]MDR6494080.1 AraC family transcriptional regulator [Paraburkholderia terricola]
MNAVTPLPQPHSGSRIAVRSSKTLGWQGFGAELVNVSAGSHRIPPLKHHRVGVHVGAPVRARCVCQERRYSRIQSHGDADVIPAGLDGQWSDESACTIFSVWIGVEFAQRTVEQLELKSSEARLRPRMQMRDPRFQHLAWALHAELEADDASDPLYAESLCTAMVVRLIGGAPTLDDKRRTLAPKTAARVIEFIEAHLDQRLTLTELAALADLSVPHFKVLFRETLGVPVHQYVVRRRVERARTLLLEGRLSASRIALDTGFAHQSHMAHWMGRLLGVTPRELIRSSSHSGSMIELDTLNTRRIATPR